MKKAPNRYFKYCLRGALVATLLTQILACVPVVVGGVVATGAMAADRRTSGMYVEDENIELKSLGRLKASLPETAHINVTSFKGSVLLTGEAPTNEYKEHAANIVTKIESVKHVTNEIVVEHRSTLKSRANDVFITSKVKTQFIKDKRFQANHVKVITENATVYLMGMVTQAEADAAVEIVRNTSGVTKVVKVFEYMPTP